MATRWDERNVNAQCRKCNRFEYGRQLEYSLNIGIELAEQLLQDSRATFKLMEHEYQEIFEKYRDLNAELEKIQNF